MDRRDTIKKMALRFGPVLLVLTGFMSILLGIIIHSISIDEVQFRSPPAKKFDQNVTIDDKLTDIIWFLQVSDLHLSNRGHFDRQKDFEEFTKTYIDIFHPKAILVTGDITDGRKPNSTLDSGQQIEEWQAYSRALEKSKAKDKTFWLDVRGNHDNFNVYNPSDPNNLYRQYSVMGKTHERNYMQIITDDSGKKYSFFGVDEVQSPGLKIPFNFLGIVKDADLEELRKYKQEAKENDSQYSIWFAHYPTSSIASPNEGLRNIIDGPYLCGHYHTIGNMVIKMHASQQPGFVELELGDWKYNRRIRLAAIDHQLFSMVDFRYKKFPVALMTNPKQAQYDMPKYEPVERIHKSTHIRVIAFSNASITKILIEIDNQPSQQMTHVKGPLYALEWDPTAYETGLHEATIRVEDELGQREVYIQTFSLDGSKEEYGFLARILLRAYFKSSVMSIFFFVVGICTLPMIILILIPTEVDEFGPKRHYKGTFLHQLHLLTKIDRLVWPLIGIPLYLSIGPMFIGYLVDEAIGVCFVWGVFIGDTFLHTGLTYNVGSLFLLLIHIPHLILLSNQVGCSQALLSKGRKPRSIGSSLIIVVAISMLQLFMGYLLISAYGYLAYFTSFPHFWCLIIYAYCWYQIAKLPEKRATTSPDERPLTGREPVTANESPR